MNVKEELEKIKEKIKKGEATPDEVTLYCRTLGGIVTSAEIGNEERITAFCPRDGVLNICIFDFKNGKGKRTCHTSIYPSLRFEKEILALLQTAREMIGKEVEGYV
ncbi:MAG TPA: hypothetical protein ENF43_01270 [Thermoplasmatales archaeon]|nr:hypothetical protein [Thermoplasmatales archaeon]